MTDEKNDPYSSLQALGIFHTLRVNLAMADSFIRKSAIDDNRDTSAMDLRFLWVPQGDNQADVHNRAVATFVTSLLYQVIENYFELKAVRKRMQDSAVEEFLSQIPDSARFLNGMRLIRNGTFHINSPKFYREDDIACFWRIVGENPQLLHLMTQTLYDFTERVFLGEIRIWPDVAYEPNEEVERFLAEIRAETEHG